VIDAALTKLLDGPEPYVFVQPEDRRRWLSKRWAVKTHSHTEGTLLTLTPAGEAVARSTEALRAALAVHPEFVHAFTDPGFGAYFPEWSTNAKQKLTGRAA